MAAMRILLRTTDAACCDVQRGQMLMAYLEDELAPDRNADFEAHLRACECCDASVHNWKTIVGFMRANPQLRFHSRPDF